VPVEWGHLSELELLDRERRVIERRIRQAKFDVHIVAESWQNLAQNGTLLRYRQVPLKTAKML